MSVSTTCALVGITVGHQLHPSTGSGMQTTSALTAFNLSGSSEILQHLPVWYLTRWDGQRMWSAPVHATLPCQAPAMLGCNCAECLQVYYAFSGRECANAGTTVQLATLGSTDAKRIDQATGGKLLGSGSLMFPAFVDWGGLYKTAHHSTGILCTR